MGLFLTYSDSVDSPAIFANYIINNKIVKTEVVDIVSDIVDDRGNCLNEIMLER